MCIHIADLPWCTAETNAPLKATILQGLCLVAQLCLALCDPMVYSLPGSSVHGDSPGKNTRVGCCDLSQGLNPALYPSQPRDQTQVSCIAGRFFIV